MDFYEIMQIYDDVFSPLYYMLFVALVVVYYDSKVTGKIREAIITTLVAYAIAYAVYSTWFLMGEETPQYVEDLLAVFGLFAAIYVAMFAVRRKIYDGIVLVGILTMIILSVPYAIISVFWNISGHVAYTTAPTVFLVRLNKKFLPLMTIPLVMVVNRPIVGAHTWAESIAGFIFAFAITWLATKNLKNYNAKNKTCYS